MTDSEDGTTVAVMLGKIEVRLDQIFKILDLDTGEKVEIWSRLRELERVTVAHSEWQKQCEATRGRSPNWTSIVMMVVSLVTLSATIGIVGMRG